LNIGRICCSLVTMWIEEIIRLRLSFSSTP
jgi:hypothetical protein